MALKPCPRCGNYISDKAVRCPKCGLYLRNTSGQAKAPDAQNISQQTLNEKPTANEGSANRSNPTIIERPYQSGQPARIDKPKKSKTGLWIFLCIILAVGIGAAIWIPVHHHNEKLKAEHLALLEQQRLDSIAAVEAELARIEQQRRDSIEFEQYKQSIDNQFVTPKDIFTSYKNGWTDGVKKMLKARGYELTNTRKFEEEWYDEGTFINTEWTYTLESPNPEYKVWNKVKLQDQGDEGEICYIEFCDEEHLQSFIKQSLKLGLKKEKGSNYYRRDSEDYLDCWNLYRANNKSLTLRVGLTP